MTNEVIDGTTFVSDVDGRGVMGVTETGAMTEAAAKTVEQGLAILSAAVSNTAHAHGWWDDAAGNRTDRNMGEMIALMHSELSEALESHRNGERALWYRYPNGVDSIDASSLRADQVYSNGEEVELARDEIVRGKPEGIASEFADVIIRILDTCHTLDVPLTQAILDKHEYNRHRSYRHGGKKF